MKNISTSSIFTAKRMKRFDPNENVKRNVRTGPDSGNNNIRISRISPLMTVKLKLAQVLVCCGGGGICHPHLKYKKLVPTVGEIVRFKRMETSTWVLVIPFGYKECCVYSWHVIKRAENGHKLRRKYPD